MKTDQEYLRTAYLARAELSEARVKDHLKIIDLEQQLFERDVVDARKRFDLRRRFQLRILAEVDQLRASLSDQEPPESGGK